MLPSPVWVIFSDEHTFLSGVGSGIVGGVCKITYSLNITDDRRRVEVGGLKNPDPDGFCKIN